MISRDQFEYEMECVMDLLILAGLCLLPQACQQQEDLIILLQQCGIIFTQLQLGDSQ